MAASPQPHTRSAAHASRPHEPPHAATHPSRAALGAALLAVWVVWGSTYLAIKLAIVSIPPFLMGGARSMIAGSLLLGGLRLRGVPSPPLAQWRNAATIGFLMVTLANGAVVWAQGTIPSSLAALGVATTPLWVALATGVLEGWPRPLEWLGLAIGFAGVVLLNGDGALRATPFAALLLLVAQLSWGAGTILNRRLELPHGAMASALQMLCGGTMLFGLALLSGERLTAMPTARSLLALAYLVVFGSIIAFSAFNFLIRNVSPALATSNAYVNPLVAVLLGVGLGGERLGPATMVAMLVILAGVALVLLAHDRGRR
jgi:drug/metabolite transporter (DMT)-like permease